MIVIDTSVLVGALSSKDARHESAKELLAQVRAGRWGRALVPDWVVVELCNFVLSKFGREQAIEVATSIRAGEDADIVPCSPLFELAFRIFSAPRGAPLSLADAGVAAVAHAHRPSYVATFDADFRALPGLVVVDHAATEG